MWGRIHKTQYQSETYDECKVTISALYVVTGAFIELQPSEQRGARFKRGFAKALKFVPHVPEFMIAFCEKIEKENQAPLCVCVCVCVCARRTSYLWSLALWSRALWSHAATRLMVICPNATRLMVTCMVTHLMHTRTRLMVTTIRNERQRLGSLQHQRHQLHRHRPF